MADAEIRINTKINDTASKDIKKLDSDFKSLIDNVRKFAKENRNLFTDKQSKNIDTLVDRLEKQNETLSKQENLLQSLKDKYAQIESGDFAQKSLIDSQKELEKTEKALKKVQNQYETLSQKQDDWKPFMGVGEGAADDEIARLDVEMQPLGEELNMLEDKVKTLKENIAEIKLNPTGTAEAEKLKQDIDATTNKINSLQTQAQSTAISIEEVVNHPANLTQRNVEDLNSTIDETQKTAKGLSKVLLAGIGGIGGIFRKTQHAANGVNKSLKSGSSGLTKFISRVKSLIVTVAIFQAIRKAIRTFVDYIGVAAKGNAEFVKSLGQIKGNLLTAFQPIITAIMPLLNMLMAALAKITAYIAAFTTALFGKTISGSKAAAQGLYDQAKATDAVGKATKKAAGQLAAFDEVNTLKTTQEDDGGGGGSDAPPIFDLEDTGLNEFSEKAKAIFDEIWGVFRKAWDREGQATVGAAKQMLVSIKDLMVEIGRTWLEVWTNGTGEEFLVALLRHLQMIAHVIADIADAFSEAWKDGDAGKLLIESIFFLFTEILKLITEIGDEFRKAWDSKGVSIANHLLNIFTNINQIIAGIAVKLREALQADGNGVAIWESLLGIFDRLLEMIDDMSAATRTWVEELNLEPMVHAFRGLMESIEPLVDIIAGALSDAYEDTILPFGKWLAELAVPVALKLLSSIFSTLSSTLKAGKPTLDGVWKGFFEPLANWTGGKIIEVLGFLQDKLDVLSSWLTANKAKFEEIGSKVQELGEKLWAVIEPIADAVWEVFIGILRDLWNGLAELITPLLELIDSFLAFVNVILDGLEKAGVFDKQLERLKTTFLVLKTAIKIAIDIIVSMFKHWMEEARIVLDFFAKIFAGDFTGALKVMEDASREKTQAILGFFTDLGNKIKNVFEGIKNSISEAFSSVKSKISGLPSRFTRGLDMNIPDTVLRTLPIPKLATGAVIPPNAEFMAILGDQKGGRNLEAPEGLIRQIVREESGQGGGKFTIEFGNSDIAQFFANLAHDLRPFLLQENDRVGGNLVTGGGGYL